MKFLGLTIAVFVSLSSAAWAAPAGGQPTAVGLWEQVDEKTALVKILEILNKAAAIHNKAKEAVA